MKRIWLAIALSILILVPAVQSAPSGIKSVPPAKIETYQLPYTLQVERDSVGVRAEPDVSRPRLFSIHPGMQVLIEKRLFINGEMWGMFKAGNKELWVLTTSQDGKEHLKMINKSQEPRIVDAYGIMQQPHRFAVKLVKYPGAKGRLETYTLENGEYKLNNVYENVTYPKEGPKQKYGDLKTVGGHIIRYLYRTTRSSMNGYNKAGEHFGVYKVAYPMPHDAMPFLVGGQMGISRYNQIPIINRHDNGQLYPHPHSLMGADILIHTKRKGSLGCINIENELMSDFYHHDITSENNTEIIPFIIYDEHFDAPEIGKLFF